MKTVFAVIGVIALAIYVLPWIVVAALMLLETL